MTAHDPRLIQFHAYSFAQFCADRDEISRLRAELESEKQLRVQCIDAARNIVVQLRAEMDRMTKERDALRSELIRLQGVVGEEDFAIIETLLKPAPEGPKCEPIEFHHGGVRLAKCGSRGIFLTPVRRTSHINPTVMETATGKVHR
jgi:hypothetical protein